jgi:hypothetical protein
MYKKTNIFLPSVSNRDQLLLIFAEKPQKDYNFLQSFFVDFELRFIAIGAKVLTYRSF